MTDSNEPTKAESSRKPRTDVLVTYGILLVLGLLFLFISLDYEFYRGGQTGRIGPGYMPRFGGGILSLLSVALILQELRKGSKLEGDSGAEEDSGPLTKNTIIKIALVLGIITVALLLVPFLGLLVSMTLTVLALIIFVEKMRVVPSLLLTLGVGILGYVLFIYLLSIPMPMGIFEGIF